MGAYEVIATLGTGGMGEVYRAPDTRLRRDVALKVLPPEVTREPGRLERFDREARAVAALMSHDGRVKVLDFGLARVGGGALADEDMDATLASVTQHGMINTAGT